MGATDPNSRQQVLTRAAISVYLKAGRERAGNPLTAQELASHTSYLADARALGITDREIRAEADGM